MWIVAIAWMFVAVLMAITEAVSPVGSILGAIITLLLYGIAPTALLMYILTTPQRRRARLAAERAADEASRRQPDAGSLSPRDPVAAEREEP